MIGWLKRTLDKVLLRPTIHRTGADVRTLGTKVDLLLSAGKTSETEAQNIRKSLGVLSREMGEQHEALADRFLENTIEARRALDALGRDMGTQHEVLVGRFLESTVELRRGLDTLTDTVNRQQETLTDRFAESAGQTRRTLEALTDTVAKQHAALAGRFAESADETRRALEALTDTVAKQHATLAGRFVESTGEARQALEVLTDAVGEQRETLAGRFAESAGETRQALEVLTDAVGEQRETLAGRFAESAGETRRALEGLTDTVAKQHAALAGRFVESTGDTRQALEALTDAMAKQHATLAGRFLEDTGETRRALETAITRSGEFFQSRVATFVRKIEALERLSFRQHEALASLSRVLKTQRPLPATRGWAASPDLLLYLYEFVVESKPAVVVEIGGGISSLVIAAALKANGRGHLFSFDHDAEYAAKTTALLEREGFADVAAVEHAPLSRWLPPAPSSLGESWEWYTLPKSLSAIGPIDILVVDGPPERTGPYARYPALPALAAQLAPAATVLLDDTIREAETKIAETWRDEFGLDLALRRDFEKGLAILMRTVKTSSNARRKKESR